MADLPYGKTEIIWDKLIPVDVLWQLYNRLLLKGSPVLLFAKDLFSAHLMLSNSSCYRYKWIWRKSTASAYQHVKARPLDNFEEILVFSEFGNANNSKNKYTYNPQNTINIYKTTIIKNKPVDHNPGRIIKKVKHTQTVANYPKTVLSIASATKQVHPTQKPVLLMEYLIKTYTNKNDLVLDNTMGSGTTGVACINTNRRFIGIEKDEKYFEIAVKRCEDALHAKNSS